MTTFHEDKLWQAAYTAVLDLCELDSSTEVMKQAQKHGLKVLSVIADGVSRKDRRERDMKFRDAMGLIAGLRSLLSVAWAQQAIEDEVFQKLETAYEALSNQLPR